MGLIGADGKEIASVSRVELHGDRVGLRELLIDDDAQALARVFSDLEVVRYLTLPVQTLDSERDFVAAAAKEARRVPRREYQLAITVGERPEPVGTCRIGIDSVEHRSATIGYAVGRNFWGQGLGTEVVRRLARFGFERLGVHRIWAVHHPDNPASGRVLTKVGFQVEGRIRDHMFIKGQWRDAVSYSLLEDEWRSRAPSEPDEGHRSSTRRR